MASCSSPNDAIRLETAFIRHIVFTEIFGAGFAPESRLTSCSVFRQTASMEAEIDCRLQSNSSQAANENSLSH